MTLFVSNPKNVTLFNYFLLLLWTYIILHHHYTCLDNGSADLTIHTPLVHLSPPFTSQEVLVTFNNDGVAFEGNETFQLCLFPLVPMESEVNFRQNIALIIQDSDLDGEFTTLSCDSGVHVSNYITRSLLLHLLETSAHASIVLFQ